MCVAIRGYLVCVGVNFHEFEIFHYTVTWPNRYDVYKRAVLINQLTCHELVLRITSLTLQLWCICLSLYTDCFIVCYMHGGSQFPLDCFPHLEGLGGGEVQTWMYSTQH